MWKENGMGNRTGAANAMPLNLPELITARFVKGKTIFLSRIFHVSTATAISLSSLPLRYRNKTVSTRRSSTSAGYHILVSSHPPYRFSSARLRRAFLAQ